VALVGILNTDMAMDIPDFRASERTGAAGDAGGRPGGPWRTSGLRIRANIQP